MSKTQELHEQLVKKLEQLVSGDDWTEMMRTASRFHNYSARNVMLIQAQRPDATRVAGFSTWKKVGRNVKRGANGIAILAPCMFGPKAASQDEVTSIGTRVGFRTAWVFDESDTEGDELPYVSPTLLNGEAPHELWNLVSEMITDRGFTIDRSDCSPANGITRWSNKSVTVRFDLNPAQATKTLTHELGHIICDHGNEPRVPRQVAEVEAESIAHIVCAAMGLDSASYSFPYVAQWSNGDIALVRSTADKVVRLAHEVITQLQARQTT